MFGLLRRLRHATSEEDLSGFIDGALSAERQRQVEAHLRACALCRAHVAELRALKQTLRSLPQAPVPRSFALPPQQAPRPARAQPLSAARAYPIVRAAAAAAVVLFLAFVGADIYSSATGGTHVSDGGAAAQGGPLEIRTEPAVTAADREGEPAEPGKGVAPAPTENATPLFVPAPATGPFEEGTGAAATPSPPALAEREPTPPEFAGEEAREAAGRPEAIEDEDTGGGWLRVSEIAAAGAALALAAAAFFLNRQRFA